MAKKDTEKSYVKRHKNDTVDTEAICEAVTRPNMRFVETKTPEQILEFDRMINAAPKGLLKTGLLEKTKPWQIWVGSERR
jgi:hypothetical protein